MKRQRSFFKVQPNFSHANRSQLMQAESFLQNSTLRVQNGKFSQPDWDTFFNIVEESSVQSISFYRNNLPIDIRSLVKPKFHSLQNLYLSFNLIVSIEAISRLNAPELRALVMMSNQITNIRAIRKGYFPKLQTVNVSNNPLKECDSLIQMTSPKLQEVQVEKWVNLPLVGQSKRWALKLPCNSRQLQQLGLHSKQRRREPPIDAQLAKKYKCFIQT